MIYAVFTPVKKKSLFILRGVERKRLYTSSRLIYAFLAVRSVTKKLINFRLPVQELKVLERYCRKRNLTKTSVFRRFLESLPKQ